jgi:hypothetical protein
MAVCASAAFLLAACGDENRDGTVKRSASERDYEFFDGVLRADHSGHLVANFHGVQFTIPERLRPSARLDFLAWTAEWPDVSQAVSEIRSREDFSKWIRVTVRGRHKALSPFPVINPDSGFMHWVKVFQLTGPHLNETLNLMEYRYPQSPFRGAVYVSPDETYLASIGRERPFVKCGAFLTSDQWDGRRECESVGSLSADVYYKYEFSEALLPNWKRLDQEMRSFILSMTATKN